MSNKNRTEITAEPGKQELFITREFDAPRELIFKAFTDAKMLKQWLGPRRLKMRIETLEARDGGAWRYFHIDEDGSEYAFRGVFHQIAAPDRIVQTFEFEGMPGHVSLETATFEELPGNRTRMVAQTVFQSVEDRDGMIQSGMEVGVRESYDRLAELLEKQ